MGQQGRLGLNGQLKVDSKEGVQETEVTGFMVRTPQRMCGSVQRAWASMA